MSADLAARVLYTSGELRPASYFAIAEGFCPYGHGRLEVVELHGRQQGACRPCGASWYATGDQAWGCACVPDDHTCGEGSFR